MGDCFLGLLKDLVAWPEVFPGCYKPLNLMSTFPRKTNSSSGLRELYNQGPEFPPWAEGIITNSASSCFLNQAHPVLLLPHTQQLIQPLGAMHFEAKFGTGTGE